jgi:hypothetical protein
MTYSKLELGLADAKAIQRIVEEIARQNNVRVSQAFADCCTAWSCSIANACAPRGPEWDEREARYMALVKRYGKDGMDFMARGLALLTCAYDNDPTEDHLGLTFERLNLSDDRRGQFFTPMNVCALMAGMSLTGIEERIKARGYISVLEPAVGAGRMVLAAANELRGLGFDPARSMFAIGVDVDPLCVAMSHITLSLCCVPAVIIHGNALSMEEWGRFATPMYHIGGWRWRRQTEDTIEEICDIAMRDTAHAEPQFEPSEQTVSTTPEQTKQPGLPQQLTLF